MEEEAMDLIAEGVNYSQCRQCCAHHRSEVPEYRTSPERSPGLLLWHSDFGISHHVTKPTLWCSPAVTSRADSKFRG